MKQQRIYIFFNYNYMKRVIVIVSLVFAGISVSQAEEDCDTLKWETIKTRYFGMEGDSFYRIGELDSATINIDTLPFFYVGIETVNISNDTFYADEVFLVEFYCYFYADTGLIAYFDNPIYYYFGMDFLPNDTLRSVSVETAMDLLHIINQIKDLGVELEGISYWQLVTGIGYTTKDGRYSNSAFYAGTDTSTFKVVRNPVGIVGTGRAPSLPQVFPNPAQTHFTVTNTENATLHLYNMVGQEVLRTYGTGENTVIDVGLLPQGVYVLKVVKDGSLSVYKIVVSG